MNNKTLMGGLIVVVVLIAGIVFLTTRGKTNQNIPTETTAPQVQSTPTPTESGIEEATGNAMVKKDKTSVKGTVKEFTVTGSPFKEVPNKISVKKGDTVKITFKNAQGTHNFVIDEFDVKTKILQAGQEDSVQFVADTTGTYKYYCAVDNHRGMGMEGTLTVE